MCVFGAVVIHSIVAQLTGNQCAAVASAGSLPMAATGAHWCGCNFARGSHRLEYTPAAAECTVPDASVSSESYTTTNVEFGGNASASFLVAHGPRGCFLRCAATSGCIAASAVLVPPQDTRCSLFSTAPTTTAPSTVAQSVQFSTSAAISVPIDNAAAMCPSDRPVASADRAMCLPSATTCPATSTGTQRRSPPSGGIRVRAHLPGQSPMPGYVPDPSYNTAGAGRRYWWFDPMFDVGTVGFLYNNGTNFQQPATPARFQINAATDFQVANTIETRDCAVTADSIYARVVCIVNASSPPTDHTTDSGCECELLAAANHALAWDFRRSTKRCRLFFDKRCTYDTNQATSETYSAECTSSPTACVASFYPTQARIDQFYVFDDNELPNEASSGDGYHVGDLLEFKRGDSSLRNLNLAVVVTDDMLYEKFNTVSCADIDCALTTNDAQCRCKCAPAVACAFFECFDYSADGIPDSADACTEMVGQYQSGTGARMNISAESAVSFSVEFHSTRYTAACRFGALRFEAAGASARIDRSPVDEAIGVLSVTATAAAKIDPLWAPTHLPAPPSPTPEYVPPPPPPPSSLSGPAKVGIGIAIAAGAISVLVGAKLVYRKMRRASPKFSSSARQALLSQWT